MLDFPTVQVRPRFEQSGWTVSHKHIIVLCVVADLLVAILSSFVGAAGYEFASGIQFQDYGPYLGLGITAGMLYCLLAWELNLYNFLGLQEQSATYLRIFFAWLATVLFVTLILFMLKMGANVSRGSIIGFFAVFLILLYLFRLAAVRWVRNALAQGLIGGRPGILIGVQDELAFLNDNYLLSFGIEVIERFALPASGPEAIGPSKFQNSVVSTALARAREAGAREIVLSFPWTESPQFDLVCQMLRKTALPVRLLPDRFVRGRGLLYATYMPLIDIQRPPLTNIEQFGKRLLDIVVSSGMLVMLAPIMLLTALAVKSDSAGPIIFRQRRKGFNGREFIFYKFRTMTVQEDGPVIPQVYEGDPRVTRLGRLLRRYSIDELPQLFNVLLGHMSLVGPRPHAVAHDDKYQTIIADYAFRHHVKPGMTGWAQVNGHRGATTVDQMKARIDLDLWYINHWSMLFDLRILAKTIFEVARARNAC